MKTTQALADKLIPLSGQQALFATVVDKDRKKVGWLPRAKQPAEEYFRQCLTQAQKRRTPLVLRQGGGSDLDLVDVSQSELVADHVRSWEYLVPSLGPNLMSRTSCTTMDGQMWRSLTRFVKAPNLFGSSKPKLRTPRKVSQIFWTYQNDDGTCHLTVASPRPRTRKPVPTEPLVTPKKRWVDTQPPGHTAPTQIDLSQSPTPTPTEAKETFAT